MAAAELLLSAHEQPSAFSLSHPYHHSGEQPRVVMPLAPSAAPSNPPVQVVNPVMVQSHASVMTIQPAYCLANSRTLVPPVVVRPPPPPVQVQPASAPSCAPGAMPQPTTQRRKARSEGPGKQGWKHEEDQTIVRMVEVSGQKWSSIAAVLPGRTDDAVRNRYLRLQRKHQAGEKKGDMWTAEEDRRIREAVLQHGLKWHEIASELPGRSANAVRNRYLRCTSAPRPEGGEGLPPTAMLPHPGTGLGPTPVSSTSPVTVVAQPPGTVTTQTATVLATPPSSVAAGAAGPGAVTVVAQPPGTGAPAVPVVIAQAPGTLVAHPAAMVVADGPDYTPAAEDPPDE